MNIEEQINQIKSIISHRAQLLGLRFKSEEIVEIKLSDDVLLICLRTIQETVYTSNIDGTTDVEFVDKPIIYIEYPSMTRSVVNMKDNRLEYSFSPPRIHILFPELLYTIKNVSGQMQE